MKRKGIVIIIYLLVLAFVLAACAPKEDGKTPETEDYGVDTSYNEKNVYTGGKHIFNVTETSSYIVQSGENKGYAIMLSEEAQVNERQAAIEFQTLFAEATGINLEIKTDNGVEYSADAKYFSFGENAFADGSGVSTTSEVKDNGYIIKTAGNSVFVKGGRAIGTLFGAYELLNQLFGYMYYAVDCYYIDTEVKDVKLCNYDIFDNPDIDQRLANYGVIYNNETLAHKLRFQLQYKEVYMYPPKAFHNTLDFLPPDKNAAHKSYWYSTKGDQLCYTARGNEAEYNALVDAMVEAMKPYIEAEPEKRIITITHEDAYTWCECESCSALREKYGTDAASNIMFVNDVAEKIEKWLDEEHNGREVTIATFAYYRTVTPPAKKQADGTWKAIDENVIARDNVTILYAPLAEMEFNHSVEDSENSVVQDVLAGWAACSKHISVWNYQTHFSAYFMPYNTYSACQDQYKKYAELGAQWIFDQGQQNNNNSTGFSMLKIYLNSQWGWDVNRDYNTLVDNFFENYFGKKDGAMRKFYEELRTWLVYLDKEGLIGGKCSDSGDSSEFWPIGLLRQWMNYIDEAYEEIKPLQTSDPERYEQIADRINLESLMPRYMLISYYLLMFSSGEQQEMKQSFKSDCERLGVNKLSEGSDLSTLTGKW